MKDRGDSEGKSDTDYKSDKDDKKVTLKQRWDQLHMKKSKHLEWAREYAQWTLPYMFPSLGSDNTEHQLSKDAIGAQAVNHLANKVVSVLFPAQRMFFRLSISEDMKDRAKKAVEAQGASPDQSTQLIADSMSHLETLLASSERKCQDLMDMVAYRPQAVNAAKLLIITGNALEYHPEGQPVQVFNLYDYCVVRDLSGEVIELMTCEKKAFSTFHPDVQVQLRALKGKGRTAYKEDDEVTIYTRVELEEDGKFHVYQAGDNCDLDTDGITFAKSKLPWIPLTWNLIRGEDYGRGLVAEYSGAFHAINVLTNSLLNIAAVMGDLKFLVNPQSLIDVPELNRSPAGSYHSGKEGDVTAIQLNKVNDAQFISTMIERYEKQLAQAFLLNSQLTRNAERVTAEEIRAQANELEMSNGGIYSRLAGTWQVQLANILLDHTNFEGTQFGVLPKVITGMDSLSRQGELDSIQYFLGYLGMLTNVPEDTRKAIDMSKFAALVGTNLQVDYEKFIKSAEQLAQEQQAVMDQQKQLEEQQSDRESRVAASKEAMKG
jgi:hypothetical protein